MKERLPGAPADNGHGEPHEVRSLKCAEDLASRLGCDNEQGDRNDVDIGGLPYFPLYANAGLELRDSVAVANHYGIAGFFRGNFTVGGFPDLLRFHISDSEE